MKGYSDGDKNSTRVLNDSKKEKKVYHVVYTFVCTFNFV